MWEQKFVMSNIKIIHPYSVNLNFLNVACIIAMLPIVFSLVRSNLGQVVSVYPVCLASTCYEISNALNLKIVLDHVYLFSLDNDIMKMRKVAVV